MVSGYYGNESCRHFGSGFIASGAFGQEDRVPVTRQETEAFDFQHYYFKNELIGRSRFIIIINIFLLEMLWSSQNQIGFKMQMLSKYVP